MGIGKLKEVDIRELWKHEQYDFSEWLSKKENIENQLEVSNHDHSNYNELMNKTIDLAVLMRNVFKKYI